MTDVHSSHDTYDELDTPEGLSADCRAVRTNMPILGKLPVVQVPAQAAYVGDAVRRAAARPMLVVSDAAAKVASRLNPFD